ncbi:MAG: hypothetical protein AAGM22_17255 [Acidobacteriota bacterium]
MHPPSDAAPVKPVAPKPATLEQRQYLDILAVAFKGLAGLGFFFGCFPLLQCLKAFGSLFQIAVASFNGFPFSIFVFELFLGTFGLLLTVAFWAYGFYMLRAAKALRARRDYVLCTVMGAVSLLLAPLGTLVGGFALVLLLNDSVKAEFGVEPWR